jgi:hypothetical protein
MEGLPSRKCGWVAEGAGVGGRRPGAGPPHGDWFAGGFAAAAEDGADLEGCLGAGFREGKGGAETPWRALEQGGRHPLVLRAPYAGPGTSREVGDVVGPQHFIAPPSA